MLIGRFSAHQFRYNLLPVSSRHGSALRDLANQVMFKTRAAVFYRDLKPRGAAEWFRPDKTRAASSLNGFKNIPGKACVKRVHNNGAFVNAGNYIREKHYTPHTHKKEAFFGF